MMKKWIYQKSLKEVYGIEPYQIVDLKALMGDSSDNIPGVKGIGEKTAKSLLWSYQTIENLYEHIDEIKYQAEFENTLQDKYDAGPQVGILRRIVAVQRFDKEGFPFEVYPNVKVVNHAGEKKIGGEGC